MGDWIEQIKLNNKKACEGKTFSVSFTPEFGIRVKSINQKYTAVIWIVRQYTAGTFLARELGGKEIWNIAITIII